MDIGPLTQHKIKCPDTYSGMQLTNMNFLVKFKRPTHYHFKVKTAFILSVMSYVRLSLLDLFALGKNSTDGNTIGGSIRGHLSLSVGCTICSTRVPDLSPRFGPDLPQTNSLSNPLPPLWKQTHGQLYVSNGRKARLSLFPVAINSALTQESIYSCREALGCYAVFIHTGAMTKSLTS